MEQTIEVQLRKVQAALKAPKGQTNKFGDYKYRSCEDILEAVKPLLVEHNLPLHISDEVVEVGGRIYVKATASIAVSGGVGTFVTAYAREEETKKGMDAAQITGAASSYARKYALNGLFLIDDTKDPDATNTHDNPQAASIPHIERARETVTAQKGSPPPGKINAVEDPRWVTVAQGAKHPGASEMLTDIHGKGEKFKFLSEKQVAAAFAAATKLVQEPQSGTVNKIADAFPGAHDERPF